MTMKRLPALLLALLLLGGATARAEGSEAPAPEDLFLLGEASSTGDVAVAEPVEEAWAAVPMSAEDDGGMVLWAFEAETEEAATAVFPAAEDGASTAYDPRTEGLLPPVRSQGAWNSCWAVAAIGAAELDGLKNSLLSTAPSITDLSERHLIYFFSHAADDPLGNSSGDYNINPAFWLSRGGNPVIAAMTLASWHGAADEAATGTAYSGLNEADRLDPSLAYADVLHLENTWVLDISDAAGRAALQDMIREHGSAVLCLYMSPDYLFAGSPAAQGAEPSQPTDPTTPDAPTEPTDPMDDPVTDAETETGELPAPTPPPAPAEDPAEDPVPEETETPEEEAPPAEDSLPAADGASGESVSDDTVSLDGAADMDAPVTDGDAADFTVCYYQNVSRNTNHEVLVVGWDDDYPAANFAGSQVGAVPPGNGAWLCRNSQGSSWSGGDGYFWLSYYDASAAAQTGGSISGRATVFDFAPADNFDHNYEYDGAAVLGYVNDSVDGRGVSTTDADESTLRWYANVFTADGSAELRGTELLRAVSTYTYRAGVSYAVQVYTGVKDASDPTSGTLAAETAGTFPYAGYHTVPLPEPVRLAKGERFAVVFRVGMAADRSLFVPACYTSANWYSTNESAEGESFVSLDGAAWLDAHGLKNEPNVRIKAFTDDADPVFPFTDVKEGAWYYADVRAAWLAGLVEGMTASTYDPSATATRAQVVTVLWRLAGSPAPTAAAAYSDVRSGAWYADAVAWAGENGIVTGYTDGSFRPSRTITRQEFLTVLYRYAAKTGRDVSAGSSLAAFPDAGSVASWARDAMAWSVGSGLQKGVAKSDGTTRLDPSGSVTRAQLAAFLNRFAALPAAA